MGKLRKCDGRCHNAKHPRCACWCRGVFHGAGAEAARKAFIEAFGVKDLPATQEEFANAISQGNLMTGFDQGRRWHEAMAAARAAGNGGEPWTA